MLEQIAWNAFEFTGNIDAYMLYRQLEDEQTNETQEKTNDQLIYTV
jgi:hypothetical protein